MIIEMVKCDNCKKVVPGDGSFVLREISVWRRHDPPIGGSKDISQRAVLTISDFETGDEAIPDLCGLECLMEFIAKGLNRALGTCDSVRGDEAANEIMLDRTAAVG